ncbi:MAG: efflux RND transporter permease subunit [Neptuniibacter sp.]
MTRRISNYVTTHAGYVFAFLMVVTLIPAYFAYTGLSLNVVLEEMLPADAENVKLFQRFGEQFGGANTTLIEIKNEKGSIYSEEFLRTYKEIAEEVYYNPTTQRHLSQSMVLRKTKVIEGGGGRVEINSLLWPDLPSDAQAMADFRRQVNSQYRGFLVSNDETSAMVIADFKDDIDYEETLKFFEDIRSKYESEKLSINVVGRPILLGEIYKSLDSVGVIMAASLAIIALMLYLYFRTWIGVFVPMFTASIATIWGLGAMGFVGYNLDPLLILLPAFIFAIVLSHGVQLTTRILDHLSDTEEQQDNCRAITREGLSAVLLPSTGAIITDAAGFAVLALAAIPSIQGLALVCSVWLLSIGPALIFAAATISLLPVPKSYKTGSVLMDKFWSSVINIEDHKYLVMASVVVAFLGGLYYSQNLTVGDTKGSAILWQESRYNADSESINTRFSFLGTDVMQIYIEGDKRTMLDPKVYQQVEGLDRFIYEHMDEVRPAQSLVPIIRKVNSVLFEGDPSYEVLPDTKDEIGFDIYMYRSKGEPGDFAAFTNNDWEIGNISFYLEDHSAETISKLRSLLDEYFSTYAIDTGSTDFLYSGGQIGIVEALNQELTDSNQSIMVAISIVILICLIALYRSGKIGMIMLLSLASANVMTYAFMAWKGVGLNISSLPLAALGVGLGVDYGIYMMDRIKEEYAKLGDVMEAMHKALSTSGNAILITALTMIAPLIPWIFFSPLRFQAEMSLLLGLVLFLNMLGALFFVPAALTALKPRSIFPEKKCNQREETAELQAL